MDMSLDLAAWSALFLGLFMVAIALGELRRPGMWRGMVDELEASAALQMIVGMVELTLGAVLYLINDWNPADWLSIVMKVIGGLMVIEALIVSAFSDRYFHFWMRALGSTLRAWAVVSLLLGLWLTVAGLHRFL